MTTSAPSGQMVLPLTCFAGASPARTSARPGVARDYLALDPASGLRWSASLARRARAGSSSRTSAPFALADWIRFSGRSLRSGTMRNGIVFPLPALALLTGGIGSGLWPTPRTCDGTKAGRTPTAFVLARAATGKANLAERVQLWPTPSARDWKGAPSSPDTLPGNSRPLNEVVRQRMWPTPQARDSHNRAGQASRYEIEKRWNLQDCLASRGERGSLNPTWVEWLMGFPLGWTALEPSETPSSRK